MCINLPWILNICAIELLRSIFVKQYANSSGCSMQTFLSPYIHHTIQKWGSDLWIIRCPVSLLWPNKTAAHFCLWNLKSYRCEGLDKYQKSSKHRPTLDYFLKAFTSYVPGSAPEVTTMNWWRLHTLLTTEVDVTQGPITNCLTSKNSASFQRSPH